MSKPARRHRPAARRKRPDVAHEIPPGFIDRPPALRSEGASKRILDLLDNLTVGRGEK